MDVESCPMSRVTPPRKLLLEKRPSRLSFVIKRIRRRLPFLCFIVFLFSVLAGGIWVSQNYHTEANLKPIRQQLLNFSLFRIHRIDITGLDLTSRESVLQELGIKLGDSLLGFSLTESRDRINQLPFVESCTVERHWPDTVIVQIVERRPFAVWQYQRRFVLVDRDGIIVASHGLGPKDAEAFLKLPLIVGEGANITAADLIDTLKTMPDVNKHITAAIRIGNRRWNLMLKNGTLVYLPESHVPIALSKLAKYQHSMQIMDRPIAVIDMRLADRMVIRLRDGVESFLKNGQLKP